MRFKEEVRRRSCFDISSSAPVILADGQTWFLPKPWFEIRPIFQRGRSLSSYHVFTYGDELDRLIMEIGQCSEESTTIEAIASLGAYLIGINYELTDLELQSLFHFRLGDRVSFDWAKQVMDVATGQSGPKAFSGGGD